MDYLQYKGLKGTIEYSEEDNVLCGRLLVKGDMISYEGEKVKALEEGFHEAVDGYLVICQRLCLLKMMKSAYPFPLSSMKRLFNMQKSVWKSLWIPLCERIWKSGDNGDNIKKSSEEICIFPLLFFYGVRKYSS